MTRKRAGIILVGIGLAFGGWRWWCRPVQKPDFRPVMVERGDIEVSVTATGVVQPRNRLEVKPPIGGRVESIRVKEGESVRRGQVLALMSSIERAALLDAARAKGPAELSHWEEIYKPAPLSAPSDGVVIARRVEPGQTVTAQDVLFVLSDRLIVKAQVDETDIGRVKPGQEARLTLDAYPGEPLEAGVEHVAFEAKTVNNVTIYEVDVLPGKVPPFMRSGMTANVSFRVDRREGVLLLPAEAVRGGEGSGKVLLPAEGGKGKPRRVEVSTGLSDGKSIEILQGLSEGDTVLLPSFSLPEARGGASPFMPSPRRGGGRR